MAVQAVKSTGSRGQIGGFDGQGPNVLGPCGAEASKTLGTRPTGIGGFALGYQPGV